MISDRIKIFAKLIVFIMLTSLCVYTVNKLMIPGKYYTQTYPTTNTYQEFYNLERNSVDAIILGSSHATTSINPQVIYDNYGIVSYNLGSEQQSPLITYYWLKEALKYQSPKVVVLDVFTMFYYSDNYVYNNLNCGEAHIRNPMDNMRFSLNKLVASKEIEKWDPTQSAVSFLLPNIRYHSRWTSLSEEDFTADEMISHGGIKGYAFIAGEAPEMSYEPFDGVEAMQSDNEPLVEVAQVYLAKIVELCKKEGIKLILVAAPYSEPAGRYKTSSMFAQENNLPYYDFCEKELYNEIGWDPVKYRMGHPNYLGAELVSDYIGGILKVECGIEPRVDSSYEVSRRNYSDKKDALKLLEINDICEYLEFINKDKYCVFVFGPMAIGSHINDEIVNRLKAIGFTTDLRNIEDGTHYVAIKDESHVVEKLSDEDFAFSGSIRDGRTIYSVLVDTTKIWDVSHTYSLNIDGSECGNKNNGLSIVVYDKNQKGIADKVNFDTTIDGIPATRY